MYEPRRMVESLCNRLKVSGWSSYGNDRAARHATMGRGNDGL